MPASEDRLPPHRPDSVLAALRAHAERAPDSVAILAPGRTPASYDVLVRQLEVMANTLRDAGISATDRVALALPNGPELAAAVLGTVHAAVCAPLAPDQPAAELANQLAGLGARLVVVARGHETAAREAASSLGLPVMELDADTVAGAFTLTRDAPEVAPPAASGDDTDAALLLFTSGTTSKPKLVPLTEQNLVWSATNIAATLRLDPADRCLNVMPLFHIHGIVAALLASLVAGGSVVCTSGFRSPDVPEWIEEYGPTWYTAVPTIHQAMLDVARQCREKGTPLPAAFRLVRSSSAALPIRVLEQLEAEFAVPVLEAYGMTEAAHQMTSNPLPQEARKPGTVGKPAGPEVAVLDVDGRALPCGSVGEIGIRGATVTTGYLDNPSANAASFRNGWFLTGDQGRFDTDGYLTITGRLKEIISRGGEKVAPREVDEALLEHPDVVHAVAFAMPHPRLGEEVGAAVVLRDDAAVTAAELRVFVGERLAAYKVPRRVVVVDEIPRGRTGKLERTNLAATLGLGGSDQNADVGAPHVLAGNDVERELAAIWQRLLGTDELPSVDVDFFELGGDSLHATELLIEIEANFGSRLPATTFLTGSTVRAMATAITSAPSLESGASVVPVQSAGSKPPLFCLLRGGSVITARHLAATLGPEQPVYGIWFPAMHGPRGTAGSVEEIAAACADAILDAQPRGPYFLFGHSFGGVVVYETARQLAALGHRIGLVVLADSPHPDLVNAAWRERQTASYRVRKTSKLLAHRTKKLLSRGGPALAARRIRDRLGSKRSSATLYVPGTSIRADLAAVEERERQYVPGPAPGAVAVLATQAFLRESAGRPDLGWAPLLVAGWEAYEVPGNHDSMIGEPYVHVLAARVGDCLDHAHAALGTGMA
jgi:oxalate---CoA ligase